MIIFCMRIHAHNVSYGISPTNIKITLMLLLFSKYEYYIYNQYYDLLFLTNWNCFLKIIIFHFYVFPVNFFLELLLYNL